MAKEDFCFTCYHLDAASDISHMNRLERGAYWDVVLQIKKFGWLSLEQIKKFLGKDFDECWPAINLVMIFDEEQQKYYLEWLETSIQKSREHSKHQSKRGSTGGRGKKKLPEENPDETPVIPQPNPKHSLKGDGNGDGNGIELIIKKESKIQTLSDLWFSEMFDEGYLEDMAMTYREHDVKKQLERFKAKVRGSPKEYVTGDTDRMRKAFNYQLNQARPDKAKPQQPKKKLTFKDLNQ